MKAKMLHNSAKCPETEQKRRSRQKQKLARVHKRLAAAGVQYEVKIAELS
jgi:hypothetical protein